MPYSSGDLISALQAYHPDVDLNSVLGNDAQASAEGGASPEAFVAKYVNDPRITQAYVQKYTAFAQPQLANLNSQIGIAQQQGQLNNAQNQNLAASTNQQFGQSAYDIHQNQQNQNESLFNQADQMGLSRSGVTAAGTGRIAANTTNQLSYNDAQRANALAQLALENQQQNLQTSANVGQLQGQQGAIQADIGQQARQDAYGNSQNYFQRQQQAFQSLQNVNPALAASSPSYAGLLSTIMQRAGLGTLDPQELQSYFKAHLSPGQGTTGTTGAGGGNPGTSFAPPPSSSPGTTNTASSGSPQYTAGNLDTNSPLAQNLSKYFQQGRGVWAGKDHADVADIMSRYGVNHDTASYYYYQLRKPFER